MEKSKEADRENVGRLFEKKNMQIRQLTTERDQLKAELNIQTEKDKSTKFVMKELVDAMDQMQKEIIYLRKQTRENQLQAEMQTFRDEMKRKNIEEAGKPQEPRRSTPQQKIAPTPLPRRLSAQQQGPKEEQQQQRVDTSSTQLFTKGGQMQNCQVGNISGKFVFVCGSSGFSNFLSSDNVEYINYWEKNLDSLVPNISSYKKELLLLTHWMDMNTTSGYANYYANLLSLCRQWKRLRPDGEIHCLYGFLIPEFPSEPDKELFSLLTTCNKYLSTGNASLISAIRQYWPKFVHSILSEEAKKKYPE